MAQICQDIIERYKPYQNNITNQMEAKTYQQILTLDFEYFQYSSIYNISMKAQIQDQKKLKIDLKATISNEIYKTQSANREAFRALRQAQYLKQLSSNSFKIANLQTSDFKPKHIVNICSQNFNNRIVQLLRQQQQQKSSAELKQMIEKLQQVWNLSTQQRKSQPAIQQQLQQPSLADIAQLQIRNVRNVPFIQTRENSVENPREANEDGQLSQFQRKTINTIDSHVIMQQGGQSIEVAQAQQDMQFGDEQQITGSKAEEDNAKLKTKRKHEADHQSFRIPTFQPSNHTFHSNVSQQQKGSIVLQKQESNKQQNSIMKGHQDDDMMEQLDY